MSLHSLRHSHASILLSKGVPVAAVSERLGHADQNITLSIYSHALPADKRAAAKVWNDAHGRRYWPRHAKNGPKPLGSPGMLANVSTGSAERG